MDANNLVSKRLNEETNRLISSAFGPRETTSNQSDGVKMSAMEEQWGFFVSSSKDKAESHSNSARWWGSVDTFFGLALIFLSASTTATALLDGVPKEVVAAIGAVSTMLAATASFLKSADRRQVHEKAGRNFRSLMVKMISCEEEKDYEKLWADFNREIMDEPMMPKRFVKKFKMKYSVTPELREIIEEKELVIAELENKKNQELEAAAKAAEELKKIESESEACTSPNKEHWKSIIEIPDIASFENMSSFRSSVFRKGKKDGEEPLV